MQSIYALPEPVSQITTIFTASNDEFYLSQSRKT